MNMRFRYLIFVGMMATLMITACAPPATPSTPDDMATNIALGVFVAQTKTAAAPTLTPSATLPPTATFAPTKGPIQPPTVTHFAPCWFGPGNDYHLESNIKKGEQVQLVGIGSIPGWYIIVNPYFQQRCWIQAINLNIDPNMDLSIYPTMTPIPLKTPKP
jgi:hypothetical protein